VELHRGRIEVKSAGPGAGSEFTVTLPTGVLTSAVEGPKVETPVAAHRILVVDDNPDSAMSLAMLLEMEGHEVRIAREGLAALRELERFEAQVVLMDIGLPGLDGYATADLIRQRRGAATPYLVALSGYGPTANIGSFDAHLAKPLELARLAEILARVPARQRPALSR
jgi:CheY-like chemotaxis protein